MKRIRIVALLLSLVLGVGVTASAGVVYSGDVNGDGKISSLDAARVLKHDAQLITLEGEALTAADFNKDGKVDSLDASRILKRDAGITKKEVQWVEDYFETRITLMEQPAEETFWYDEEYRYFFGCIDSLYYVVHYTDGTKENIVQALHNGNIALEELDAYGVHYMKEPIGELDYYLQFKYYLDDIDSNDLADPERSTPKLDAALEGRAEIHGTLQTEGFVNTAGFDDASTVNLETAAQLLAASEFEESFEKAAVDTDYQNDVYAVWLYNSGEFNGSKIVYLDAQGITRLIIHNSAEEKEEAKRVDRIVDESEGKAVENTKEVFYSLYDYTYSFDTAKSKYITVYYTDGTTDTLKDAIDKGVVTPNTLKRNGIAFIRENVNFSSRFAAFSWEEVANGVIAGETERITEGFVYGAEAKVITSKSDALAMALRQTDVEYTDYSVSYDGNTDCWCVSFTLTDGNGYQNVYLYKSGGGRLIINGTKA